MDGEASTSFALNPGQLRRIAADIAVQKLSPVSLVRHYLNRIKQVERHVRCWCEVDTKGALAVAREREEEAAQGRIRGPLHGIPIAIKDLIDVEGMRTRAGSATRAYVPQAAADAEIVLALRAQGAIILGKVHTTEFAFQDPAPTRNPFNIDHTPGGSSSGSAAVVASGMLPAAVGTQTGASVNRPAAYCGIAAFKPSSGSLSTWGVTPLAPSYDTPGFFGWSMDDAAYLFEAVAPAFIVHRPATANRIYILEDPHWSDATREMLLATQEVVAACERAGHTVVRQRSPIDFGWLFALQRTTMLYEASRALHFLNQANTGIGDRLRAALDEGAGISRSRYLDERAKIEEMRRDLFLSVEDSALFLWPAAPSTAPEGLNWTGDTKYISPWTALGGPIATLPSGVAANGLPRACILIAGPGNDRLLCDVARRVATQIAPA
ncbi:MAG: amidase [Hyphomicrobiaceae bacterium]